MAREPWFEAPRVDAEIERRGVDPTVAGAARSLHHDGFAVVRAAAPADLIARVVDDTVAPLRGAGRVQDAWRTSESVRELAVLPAVLDLLRELYDREPVPFQTLNFEYGTQQAAHSDLVHFNSIPSRFMCGVWVALEDTDAANGPLFYHPGSHRLPDPYFQRFGLPAGLESYDEYARLQRELLEAHGIAPVEFHARAGDALIWSANLVHGGTPITAAGRTRWSQVTHYFFADCVYVTPLYSDPELGEWYVRRDLVDIRTGRPAEQTLDGEPVHFEPLDGGRVRIVRGPAPAPADGEAQGRPEVDTWRARAHAAEEEVRALRRSASFRVGNALIRPARWLRARVRRSSSGR